MARKRKARSQRLSNRTEFRQTTSEKRALRRIARSKGMTIASFLRSILSRQLG